jgi:RHS repeat-associated protein
MRIEQLSFFPRVVTWVVLFCFSTTQVVRADEIIYFHNDAAGTPQVATDTAGSVLWREHYRPYGGRLDFPAAASTNVVWFTGKPQDASTGLSYMGARYYDASLGRFTGMDPSAFDEQDLYSLNRYTYANNNPYKNVDPDGKNALLLFAAAAVLAFIVIYGTATTPKPEKSRELARQTESLGSQLARGLRNVSKQDEKDDNPTVPAIDTDSTGKVHGAPLPEAEDVPKDELDDAIDALGDSIGVREDEQDDARGRGQNTSPDPNERMKYRRHQDRINDEKKLLEALKRIRQRIQESQEQTK